MGTQKLLFRSFLLFITIHSYVRALQVPFRDELPRLSKTFKPVINEDIHTFVNEIMQNKSMKGLSMAVVRSDGEAEYGSWGISTEYGDKVTPETLFGLASSSRIFSSAAWAILADDFDYGQNKTPLPPGITTFRTGGRSSKFFPDILQCPDRKDLTANSLPKNILCDGFGRLPYSHAGDFPGLGQAEISPYSERDDIIDIIRRSEDLSGIPHFSRTRNDILQMTTSQAIAQYSGMRFTDFVQERIFNNLSMSSTAYLPIIAEESGLMSHFWTRDGRRIPFYNSENTHYSQLGADGVITNAVDMARWLKFLWSDGTDPDTNITLISDGSYHLVTTPRTSFTYGNGTVGKYTKAWREYDHINVISHSGSLPGASSMVIFYPRGAFGLTLLANTDSLPELYSIIDYVIQETFHLEPSEPIFRAHFSARYSEPRPNPPGNTTTPLPLGYYAGIYSNPGYGEFQLCSSQSKPTDKYCEDVLESFRIVDSTASPSQDYIPQLLASWPRKRSSHLRLVHRSGNIFTSSTSTLFANGYGEDKSPFEIEGDGTFCSAFEIEDGFVVGLAIFDCFQFDRGNKTINQYRNSTTTQSPIIAWFDKVA